MVSYCVSAGCVQTCLDDESDTVQAPTSSMRKTGSSSSLTRLSKRSRVAGKLPSMPYLMATETCDCATDPPDLPLMFSHHEPRAFAFFILEPFCLWCTSSVCVPGLCQTPSVCCVAFHSVNVSIGRLWTRAADLSAHEYSTNGIAACTSRLRYRVSLRPGTMFLLYATLRCCSFRSQPSQLQAQGRQASKTPCH